MMIYQSRKNRKTHFILPAVAVFLVLSLGVGIFYAVRYLGWVKPKYYTAAHFHIATVHSSVDFNKNGVDDYTDFLFGARKDAENHPRYDSAYVVGGYPPDNTGVCTDVVWRAFRHAGYSLKDMIDRDIAVNTDLYPRVEGKPDPNIDFRRVPNLSVFFSRFAQSLTTDISRISEWQPGDIVIFGTNHTGIVSDRRNKQGRPYLIHNAGQPVREEDRLDWGKVSGHFRFDASKVSAEDLIAFKG